MTDPGSNETAIRAAFAQQGVVWCREFGSPLTGLLCDLAGRRLDRSTKIGRRILDWPGQPDLRFDALPLRPADLARTAGSPDRSRRLWRRMISSKAKSSPWRARFASSASLGAESCEGWSAAGDSAGLPNGIVMP